MAILHKHNPLLRDRLTKYVESGNAEGLKSFMQSLTVSAFRTSGYLLAEEVLVKADNDIYWRLFITLVPTNAKAYLGTFLKAAVALYKVHKLELNIEVLRTFSQYCSSIDRKKILEAFLPCLLSHVEVKNLLNSLECDTEDNKSMTYMCLLRSQTLPCYYELFLWLNVDNNTAQTRQCIMHLIRMNTPMAYKMASLLKSYFDIENVPVTFSLNIESYQLSRLDQGYDKFKKMLS